MLLSGEGLVSRVRRDGMLYIGDHRLSEKTLENMRWR